jgi:putative transposase
VTGGGVDAWEVVLIAYKTQLDPNNKQKTILRKCCKAARLTYNWGLQRMNEEYEKTGKSPSAFDLMKELTRLRDTPLEEGGDPWTKAFPRCVVNIAIINLEVAFKNFFRRCKKGAEKKGHPKFKSVFGNQSFSVNGLGKGAVSDRSIEIPRIGRIRLKEKNYIPQGAKIKSVTVTERAGRWFVSALTEDSRKRNLGADVIGVDVGSRNMAVLSDCTVFENPRAFRTAEKKLRRLNQDLARKKKGSINRRKAKNLRARLHYRTACIRRAALDACSSQIVEKARVIVIEDLNVSGMLKNRCLSKSISDAGMGELHTMIKYKAEQSGCEVIEVSRWYPSSKTCSKCGVVNHDLKLGDERFVCECGFVCDRDLNAAFNLQKMAFEAIEESKTEAKTTVAKKPRRRSKAA